MNLFSDNKRIIKNNFKIIVFPTAVSIVLDISYTSIIPDVVPELCDIYESYNYNIEEEINPMLKSKS